MTYRQAADHIERLTAHKMFLPAFLAITAALTYLDLNTGNFFMSIVTAAVVIMNTGNARADRKALHAKLDALIRCADIPDDLVRVEDRQEAEIEQLRK